MSVQFSRNVVRLEEKLEKGFAAKDVYESESGLWMAPITGCGSTATRCNLSPGGSIEMMLLCEIFNVSGSKHGITLNLFDTK